MFTARQHAVRVQVLGAAAALLLAGAALPGHAAGPPASAPPTVAAALAAATPSRIEAIPAAEITVRADADEQFIREVTRRADAGNELQGFDEALARQATAVDELAAQSGGDDLALLSVRRLESLRRHWQLFGQQLASLRTRLARSTRARSEDAASLADRRAAWQATRQASADLAPALLQRVDELVTQTERAEALVSPPLGRILALGRKASALENRIQAGESAVAAEIAEQDRRLAELDSPPLWQGDAGTENNPPMAAGLDRSAAIETAFVRDYNRANTNLIRLLTVIGVLLLPLLLWLRRRAVRLIAADDDRAASLRPLTRPWSAWLVLLALGSVWFDLHGPTVRQQIVVLLAWWPVMRLLPPKVVEGVGPLAWVSAAFYLLNIGASLLVTNELVYRWLLLAMDLLMLATLVWLMARSRHSAEPPRLARRRLRNVLLFVAAAVVAVAAVSNVVGNASLATMLTGAVLDSTYLALSMLAAATVLVALFRVLWGPRAARLQTPAGSLIEAGGRLGRLLMALACLLIILRTFRIYQPLADLLASALGATFQAGQLSISLGSVVAFVFAVLLAFWLARTIRLLLAEEILPKMTLPTGVGNSISTLTYFTILFVGLLAALAVLGFPLAQLAIIFGALGVGIGFGLQDMVKNFVAGLILMFERPIRPGDVVDVAGMSGTVREIGMRVTRVGTFDGADVVVPNGMLLADKLVNWTLSGSHRRIELEIGTGPDDPPRRTLELLVAIASRQEGVAAVPSPVALMTGLAGGTLQFVLRAWTIEGFEWPVVRSNLAVRLREGLAEAGIALPRPQSDLHLSGLSDQAAERLGEWLPAPPQSAMRP